VGYAKIQDFVSSGGTYVGICAGAYFACTDIEFEKGNPKHEIIKTELNLDLCDGKAVGTLFGDFDERVAFDVEIDWTEYTRTECMLVKYLGGCWFEDIRTKNVDIVARYRYNDRPAVIRFPYGRGNVVLSGAHIELQDEHLNWLLRY